MGRRHADGRTVLDRGPRRHRAGGGHWNGRGGYRCNSVRRTVRGRLRGGQCERTRPIALPRPRPRPGARAGGRALWSRGVSGAGPWTEARCPVASISGTTITMAQPCWDNSTKRQDNLVGGNSVNGPDHVENAFEVLDSPGEWYLDRAAERV